MKTRTYRLLQLIINLHNFQPQMSFSAICKNEMPVICMKYRVLNYWQNWHSAPTSQGQESIKPTFDLTSWAEAISVDHVFF